MRAFSTAVVLAVLVAAPGVRAAPPAKLTEAKALYEDLNVDGARKALDGAATQGAMGADDYAEYLGLRGLVEATLGRTKEARDAFLLLLVLRPDWKLPADQPPRVRTPFYEAKGLAAENGLVTLEAEAVRQGDQVKALRVVVKKDPLRAGKRVAFHLVEGGKERLVRALVDANGRAETAPSSPSVTWWAELTTGSDDVLLALGSAAAPRTDGSPAAVATAVSPPAREDVVAPPPSSSGWVRPVGFGVLGAGAVAGGVGLALGLMAEDARARIRAAETDGDGLITGLSQREAYALDASARTNSLVANVLFGAAAALAGTGLVMVLVKGPTQSVSLVPGPGGVTLAGSF